jgi:regulator of sigma E protease
MPLGGFVRLKGESGETSSDDSFAVKPAWQRLIVLGAGVFMNWMLAATIFTFGFMIGVPAQIQDLPPSAIIKDQKIQFTSILPGSAAEKAGLEAGSFVIEADGKTLIDSKELQSIIASKGTSTLMLKVETADKSIKAIDVAPAYIQEINRPGLGVTMADTGIVRFPWYQAIGQGFYVTFGYTKAIISAFGSLIDGLLFKQELIADVSGPVGIAVMTGKIASQGAWQLLQFMALLSINLAIVNFLPVPALDGGRALFVIIESIRRRKIKPELEANLHKIGFIALISLVIIVTFRDLRTFGPGIVRGIRSLIGF